MRWEVIPDEPETSKLGDIVVMKQIFRVYWRNIPSFCRILRKFRFHDFVELLNVIRGRVVMKFVDVEMDNYARCQWRSSRNAELLHVHVPVEFLWSLYR